MPDRIVDIKAAARSAGVSVRTIYRWIDEGLLHAVASDPVMVRLDEIDAVPAKRARVLLVKRLTS